MRIGRLDISCGASRRYEAGELDSIRSMNGKLVRFGRCWWFWSPSLRWNGGRFWRKQVTDLNLMFLCYRASVTIWGN
jgi:hypothetical protein